MKPETEKPWIHSALREIDRVANLTTEERAEEVRREDDDRREEQKERNRQYKARMRQEQLVEAGISPRHIDAKIEFLEKSEDWRRMFHQISDNLGRGFTIGLVGHRGTGKTQAATECIRQLIHGGFRNLPLIIKARRIILTVQSSFKSSRTTELDVIPKFTKPDLLVIDEYGQRGKSTESTWSDEVMFDVLDRRYDYCRDTIIISNQSIAQFTKDIGPSVCDRMSECGGIIDCAWPSFRQNANHQPHER